MLSFKELICVIVPSGIEINYTLWRQCIVTGSLKTVAVWHLDFYIFNSHSGQKTFAPLDQISLGSIMLLLKYHNFCSFQDNAQPILHLQKFKFSPFDCLWEASKCHHAKCHQNRLNGYKDIMIEQFFFKNAYQAFSCIFTIQTF